MKLKQSNNNTNKSSGGGFITRERFLPDNLVLKDFYRIEYLLLVSRTSQIWRHLICFLASCPLALAQSTSVLVATYSLDEVMLSMDYEEYVNINVTGSGLQLNDVLHVTTLESYIATVTWNSSYLVTEEHVLNNRFEGTVSVYGHFLGRTDLVVEGRRGTETFAINGTLPLIILRPVRVIDNIFNTSVGIFISLIFINFGCAMHWPTVKEVVKKPVGPLIGLAGQFLFLPLMTFGLGYLIFPNQPEMRLGMFFTGVAPGGGASNVWTFLLGGNLNLSLAMTTISTLAAFGLMPAWLFSLGQVIFRDASIVVPYARVAYFTIGLVVPMSLGLGMQRWTPRIAAFMVRILKVFSTGILLFIIVFAIITNVYIFELFTWQIIVCGMGIPWLGYSTGYVVARLLKQPHRDALAISIETGITNTGIAIFLLRYALPQPEADLTTVVPVSAAIMTPFPMMLIFAYQRIRACMKGKSQEKIEVVTPELETPNPADVSVVEGGDKVTPRDTKEEK